MVCDDRMDEMYACVLKFTVSGLLHLSRYNLHKQNIWGVVYRFVYRSGGVEYTGKSETSLKSFIFHIHVTSAFSVHLHEVFKVFNSIDYIFVTTKEA